MLTSVCMLSRYGSFMECIHWIAYITPLVSFPLETLHQCVFYGNTRVWSGREQQRSPSSWATALHRTGCLYVLLMEVWLLKGPRPTRQGGAPRWGTWKAPNPQLYGFSHFSILWQESLTEWKVMKIQRQAWFSKAQTGSYPNVHPKRTIDTHNYMNEPQK